ncbi:LOW QUALITY PROTEIN: SET domain containing 2 [Leptinotarsa decemlineata]|uniref:LOW QUALITY PROTEIN: SET domain containing 2 n=1 Tax=Leptinotarsa decemlineata TaxID=7539 RepID=UPI003D304F0F
MPPKKKKTPANPVVVGTVSTRSTRRQSIVNIEIPKSSKITKHISKTAKGSGKEHLEKPTILNKLSPEILTNTIRNSYEKVFGSISEMPTFHSDLKKQLLPIASKPQSSSAVQQATVSNVAKSNKALLQILQDWEDDEDSQDDKSDIQVNSVLEEETTNRGKGYENLEFDADDISEIIGHNYKSTVESIGKVEDDAEIFKESSPEKKTSGFSDEIDKKMLMETDVSENYTSDHDRSNLEECFVQESQEIVVGESVEVAYEDDGMGCIIEEIVPEKMEEVIISDGMYNMPNTEENHDDNITEIPLDPNDVEGEDIKVIEDVTVSEECQSVSTSDSNDAEVRKFFSQEIENETILEKNNSKLSDATISESENDSLLEKQTQDREFKNETSLEFGEKIQSDDNKSNVGIQPPHTNDCEEKVTDPEDRTNPKAENVESMETEEHVTIETTTIEKEVEKLHLQDEPAVHQFVSNSVLERESNNLPLSGVAAVELDSFSEQEQIDSSRKIRTRRIKTPQVTERQFKMSKQVLPSNKSKEKVLTKTVETKSKEKKKQEVKTKNPLISTSKKVRSKTDVNKTEKKDKKEEKTDQDSSKKSFKVENDLDDMEVRRSSRIKFINHLNKKTTGRGLVKSKSESSLNECDVSDSNSVQMESEKSTPTASPKVMLKERKTRWTRSSDNITAADYPSQSILSSIQKKIECHLEPPSIDNVKAKIPAKDPVIAARLKQFVHLKENLYKTDRMTCKEAKKMTCDCFLTAEEKEANEFGCGEDCLNRLLLIECGNLCQVGERCTNKRFQKGLFAPVEVFNTEKKGLGLRAAANIAYGEFILEYVGEVLDSHEFDKRAEVYSQDKNIHYYFMALRADAIIDATMKGNISRFINHSCDPNAETQKWTANGELRIGFFSTRTILAGEEITFDYRFQRYGKEAQKCYCGASICRGWLGEQPDSEDEEDEEEEEEDDEILNESLPEPKIEPPPIKDKVPELAVETVRETEEMKVVDPEKLGDTKETQIQEQVPVTPTVTPAIAKKKCQKKKPRIELFEEIDQLNEEMELLITTGLKNQAHTLKLSRLMVRAKETQQRTKLLRVLRRGELPCRRLFLDYHGLRLIHGYMIDAQHLVMANKKYESVRLEILQTLAVLPIPNKTMLQDSKVLATVEKWSTNKELTSPLDSDSNSPKIEQDVMAERVKKEIDVVMKKEDSMPERSIEDQEEEIKFLATKLLEEWKNLPEVFRIPKKERIEQMKEHEREANKKFMQNAQNVYGGDHDKERKSDRYRSLSRYKSDRDTNRKPPKPGEKPSAEFLRLSKIERRKLFALQHELKEEERRMKQRELWRQHEMNCLMIGTDPRFTAPFDPSRGYQCIWNPQIGQWQNYPLPPNTSLYPSQPPQLPNLNIPPPQIPKSLPNYSYTPPLGVTNSLSLDIAQLPISGMSGSIQLPAHNVPEITTASSLHPLAQNITRHPQIPMSHATTTVPLIQYQEQINVKEEDLSQVKFMGPIPPPAKLPPKWKCAKDKYGRPYYYHIKIRKSQWEPPPVEEPTEENDSFESESSSDTSTVSSDTSSENSESEDDIDDTKLLLEVRKQMDSSSKVSLKSVLPEQKKMEESMETTPSPEDKISRGVLDHEENIVKSSSFVEEEVRRPSIDMRLKELDLFKDDKPPKKKRRVGLCEEIIISPRTEEDKKQFKEDIKRYKANKEKLKRQKELILQQTKKQLREIELKKIKEKRSKPFLKVKIKDLPDFNSDAAKKIKETFRTNMASTVVSSLNAYRKTDCTEGRITNTDDFKHLARKLTHFVMLKEMKHISKIEDLTCTDNVKMKAREYIRKYMSKFGEVYVKRNDSPDFKD